MKSDWMMKRTTAAVRDAVSIEVVKKHLELGESNDDHNSHLAALITAASEQVEHDTQRALITQTWTGFLSKFPDDEEEIALPVDPVQSVTSISYYDTSGVLQVWDAANYTLNATTGVVRLATNSDWPDTQERSDAVSIVWVAGYGSQPDAVPAALRQAVLLQIGKWFVDREMMANNVVYTDEAYERLIRRYMRASYP